MTGLSERRQVTAGLTEAIAAGARRDRACAVLGRKRAYGATRAAR